MQGTASVHARTLNELHVVNGLRVYEELHYEKNLLSVWNDSILEERNDKTSSI